MVSIKVSVIIALVQLFNFCYSQQNIADAKIRVTKCCAENLFYSMGYDECKPFEQSPTWPPPVHIKATNKTMSLDSSRFEVNHNTTMCPEGYVNQTTKNFKLYLDGSVATADVRLNYGEFCINEAAPDPTTVEAEFVIRYCVRNPCMEKNCVRKCCPMGMALNVTTKLCQWNANEFKIEFHDTSGAIVPVDANSYVVRDGAIPSCEYGMYALAPLDNPEEEFIILPNGQIYVTWYPENERNTSDYCTEDFLYDGDAARQALLCFGPQSEETQDNQVVLKIFPYLLFISSIFLIATFVVYAIIPEIRNIHGVTIMCHVASLAVMYIGLGIIQLNTQMQDGFCVGLAVVVHFAFLSTFTWLNVMSFDIWWTFSPLNKSTKAKEIAVTFWMQMLATSSAGVRQHRLSTIDDDDADENSDETGLLSSGELRPRNTGRRAGRQRLGRRIVFYSIYAWGVPFIIVLIGQILDHMKNLPSHIVTPGFGTVKCWFHETNAYMAYLYGPIAILILCNIVFFVMTAVLLYRASVDTALAVNSAHAKQKFRVIFSLFILMGVFWIMEVVSFAAGGSAYIWIPTDILNILTGVFIFIIFVCKPNVWKLLKNKIPCLKRLDRCCPSCMTKTSARHGTTTRSTRNEVSLTKSLNNHAPVGGKDSNDSKKRISMSTPTQSTQLRESTQIDSGDEMLEQGSVRMA